jgi:hypothetical protein
MSAAPFFGKDFGRIHYNPIATVSGGSSPIPLANFLHDRARIQSMLENLIGRELQKSQDILTFIKESRSQAKGRCFLLKATLRNAREYLRELEKNL